MRLFPLLRIVRRRLWVARPSRPTNPRSNLGKQFASLSSTAPPKDNDRGSQRHPTSSPPHSSDSTDAFGRDVLEDDEELAPQPSRFAHLRPEARSVSPDRGSRSSGGGAGEHRSEHGRDEDGSDRDRERDREVEREVRASRDRDFRDAQGCEVRELRELDRDRDRDLEQSRIACAA